MTKIKYSPNKPKMFKYHSWNSPSILYKYSVPVPGFLTILFLITLTLSVLGFLFLDPGTGNQVAQSLFAASGVFLTTTAIAGFVTIMEAPGMYVLGYKYYFPTRKCPAGMDRALMDSPYYQEALSEHWNGKDIGSMAPLNKVLHANNISALHQKSDIVELLAKRAEDEYKFIELGVMK